MSNAGLAIVISLERLLYVAVQILTDPKGTYEAQPFSTAFLILLYS